MYRDTLIKIKGLLVNFLAHSLFADGDSERLAGQFAGDFVRGKDLSGFSPAIAVGIQMHRFIDSFTDHHPAAIAVRDVFDPPVRRFAGIITDVVFDHYLATDWVKYSDRDLSEHIEYVHESLRRHNDALPHSLQRFARFIKAEGVLESNVTFAGAATTLHRLAQRSDRFAPIADGAAVAQQHEPELRAAFDTLFPELIEASIAHRKTL